MVGPNGLEPSTSSVSRKRSNQLSYGPALFALAAKRRDGSYCKQRRGTRQTRLTSLPSETQYVPGKCCCVLGFVSGCEECADVLHQPAGLYSLAGDGSLHSCSPMWNPSRARISFTCGLSSRASASRRQERNDSSTAQSLIGVAGIIAASRRLTTVTKVIEL